jgi:AcrR family transcriptional regulator
VSSKIKPQPLPRGRHGIPPDVVRASQRERLLQAMLDSVAERGYEATTVPTVVAAARVSRNAFYELFSDKLDCFLALCDQMASEMLDTLLAQRRQSEDWVVALRSGTALYLRWWQEHPAFSRTYFIELPIAGPRAVAQRDRQYARFREMFEALGAWARVRRPDLPPLAPLVPRMLVVATTELVAEEVRAGRVDRLTELEEALVPVLVRLLAE